MSELQATRQGQAIDFLSLPIEIRLLVYEHACNQTEEVLRGSDQAIRSWSDIAHICRQVRNDIPVLWRKKTLRFEVHITKGFWEREKRRTSEETLNPLNFAESTVIDGDLLTKSLRRIVYAFRFKSEHRIANVEIRTVILPVEGMPRAFRIEAHSVRGRGSCNRIEAADLAHLSIEALWSLFCRSLLEKLEPVKASRYYNGVNAYLIQHTSKIIGGFFESPLPVVR